MDTVQQRLNRAFRPKEKAGRIRQQNESNILKAAEIEFAQNGYNGTSLNAIADRAELPKSNILYYFKSKLGLYGAVLADILEMWNQAFNEATIHSDPSETLYRYIDSKIRYSATHPLSSRIFAMEIIQGAPHLEEYFAQDFRNWIIDRASVLNSWMDAGKMKRVNPVHFIFMIWSTTQNYADFATQVKWAIGQEQLDKENFDEALETIATVLLKGVGLSIPVKLKNL